MLFFSEIIKLFIQKRLMIQLNQLTVYAAKEILKWVGKSYLGYIGVGIMLWDFTDCMSHF